MNGSKLYSGCHAIASQSTGGYGLDLALPRLVQMFGGLQFFAEQLPDTPRGYLKNMNRKPRLDDVDSAKGLAIFLVVLGHISGGVSFPPNSDWYILLNRAIYQFHMSFFMFLSGLVFFYTYRPIRTCVSMAAMSRAGPGGSRRRTSCSAH